MDKNGFVKVRVTKITSNYSLFAARPVSPCPPPVVTVAAVYKNEIQLKG